ncbi:hypothetical protein ACHAP8_005872 [Fusarium lateritium]
MTIIYPTSTIGGQSQVTGGGSLIYTTAFPTLGSDGPNQHTYTVTVPCDEIQCMRLASGERPPAFTATTAVCHTCGEKAIATTLTLPVESGPAAQVSASGDTCKDDSSGGGDACQALAGSNTENNASADLWASDAYPNIHSHVGTQSHASPTTETASKMTTVNASNGGSTGASFGVDSESASSAYPSSSAPASIVVTDFAPGSRINRATLIQAAIVVGLVLIVA